MCDCPCKCWQLKPVRQRVTNTFIHADIFNSNQPNTLNVKCDPKPGDPHNCKCTNLWQKPVLKDTRYRPLDHPDQYFFNQELGGCGCCNARQSNNCNEIQRADEPANFGTGAQSLYYLRELPPAGKYDGTTKAIQSPACQKSYHFLNRGIHTGQTVNYDGHESHKDVWFNDGKEIEIKRLNDHLGRGYSGSRKRLDMASNAFDFVDHIGESACPEVRAQTAKFQTSRFQNDCSQLNHQNQYANTEDKKPHQNIAKKEKGVTFKVKTDSKISTGPKVAEKTTTLRKEQTAVSTGKVGRNMKQVKVKTVTAKQQKSTAHQTAANDCKCTCQCWKTRDAQKNI